VRKRQAKVIENKSLTETQIKEDLLERSLRGSHVCCFGAGDQKILRVKNVRATDK